MTGTVDHLPAITFLLAQALEDHLDVASPCGSSRGGTALARYQRWVRGELTSEDYETMAGVRLVELDESPRLVTVDFVPAESEQPDDVETFLPQPSGGGDHASD